MELNQPPLLFGGSEGFVIDARLTAPSLGLELQD